MRLLILLALILLTPFSQARAQPIPGADDLTFVSARDAWLQGDDLMALGLLSGLARTGNTAAQMLLSQIALAPLTHSHVTESMPRRDRIALLRQEGGLSGRDWMQAAAESHPLADAYWSSRVPLDDDLQIARYVQLFLNFGDLRTAAAAITEPLNYAATDERQRRGYQMIDLYSDRLGLVGQWLLADALTTRASFGPVRVPTSVRTQQDFLAYIDELRSPAATFAAIGVQTIRADFAPVQTPDGFMTWAGQLGYDNAVLEAIDQVPDAAPITSYCTQACSTSIDTCRVSLAEALTISGRFPYPLASPSPAFVSDAAYQASPRFLGDVDRIARAATWRWQGCTP